MVRFLVMISINLGEGYCSSVCTATINSEILCQNNDQPRRCLLDQFIEYTFQNNFLWDCLSIMCNISTFLTKNLRHAIIGTGDDKVCHYIFAPYDSKSHWLFWIPSSDIAKTYSVLFNNHIPAWLSNYTHFNVWLEITYSILNFNGATVEA